MIQTIKSREQFYNVEANGKCLRYRNAISEYIKDYEYVLTNVRSMRGYKKHRSYMSTFMLLM